RAAERPACTPGPDRPPPRHVVAADRPRAGRGRRAAGSGRLARPARAHGRQGAGLKPCGSRPRAADSLGRPLTFYVTTPIYYVTAQPHLGHPDTTIGTDTLARHHRQRGDDVFFLTGTDEHGEPVARAAEAEGVSPRELADRNAERFRALGPQIDVSNDFFIRTSDPEHGRLVQEVMQRIHDNGHTYKAQYEGWYCPRCADFKTEAEIGPDNTCPIHGIKLDWESEVNWFFRLSTFQEPLEKLYAEQPGFVAPETRYNEALSFIRGGLQDVSLSREKL